MSGKVIQGTFLCGRPAIRTPAAPPPPPRQPGPPLAAHVAQPRSAHPQTPGGAMLRQPVPPAPAHVAQPQLVQRQPQPRVAAGAMPQRPGPPAPAFVAQPRSVQPHAPAGTMPRQPGPPAPAFAAQARPAHPLVQPQAPGGAVAVDASLLRPTGRPGRPLPDALQRKMEQAFAADFSGVRVHEGPQAESIGAIAFTVGSDIYFAPGRFQPHTAAGQQLLGHELAHVLQQRSGRVRNPLGSGLAVVQDHALEAEADRMGHRAAAQMMPAAAAAQVRTAQAKSGHKLVFGTYLHRGPGAAGLPPEAAGHTFVAVEGPGGRREAFGFSPANPGRYDFQRDIGQLRAGVPGAVRREDGAFAKPGVRTRSYDVGPEQARAALAKVAEYKAHAPAFSFSRRDCGQFAADVLKAAGVGCFSGSPNKRPADLYGQITVGVKRAPISQTTELLRTLRVAQRAGLPPAAAALPMNAAQFLARWFTPNHAHKIVEAIAAGAGWEVWLQVQLMRWLVTRGGTNLSGQREIGYPAPNQAQRVDFYFQDATGNRYAVELKVENAIRGGSPLAGWNADRLKLVNWPAADTRFAVCIGWLPGTLVLMQAQVGPGVIYQTQGGIGVLVATV